LTNKKTVIIYFLFFYFLFMSIHISSTSSETQQVHPNSLEANPDFEMNGKKLIHKPSGFSRYLNTAASASVILTHKWEALLARRNQEPEIGKLVIPGGFVEAHESLEEAAAREVREEVWIDVDINDIQYVTSSPNVYNFAGNNYHTVDPFFTLELKEKVETILQAEEVAASVWVPLDGTFDMEEMAFDSHKKAFLAVLKKHLWEK